MHVFFQLTSITAKKFTWVRVILCRITYDVVVSLFLNTLFTSMLWSTPFLVIAGPKLIKKLNFITIPSRYSIFSDENMYPVKAKGEPLIGPPFYCNLNISFLVPTNWTYIIIWFIFKVISIIYISTNTTYPLFFFSVCRCFCRCALF